MKPLLLFFTVIAFLFQTSCTMTGSKPVRKVLMVAGNGTTVYDVEKNKSASNSIDEYTGAYMVFRMAGYDIDIVTPLGGEAVFSGFYPEPTSPYVERYEGFGEKKSNTLSQKDIKVDDYEIVFYGGGYGVVFELKDATSINRSVGEIYSNGGVLAGCGHGPAGLAHVVDSKGNFIVAGKTVTGFPNSTEQTKDWADYGRQLPFTVEDILRKNGAKFLTKEDLNDKYDIVSNQRIVTSMFKPMCGIVAKEAIDLKNGKL